MEARDYFKLTISLNGELHPDGSHGVSVWDHGLLYGDGCFEGLRIRNGRVFRFEQHYARLVNSARILGIEVPFGFERMLGEVVRVAKVNSLTDAHVRIVLTRGPGKPGIDPRRSLSPTLLVAVYPFPPLLGSDPVELIVSSVIRKAPRSVDSHVKSLNYLDSILAKMQAIEAGVHDALMLDDFGTISEATGANIFVLREGVLKTPTTRSALPGITRRSVLELADTLQVSSVEGDVTIGEVYSADEVFLTGSGVGIAPVCKVDGRVIPAVGPVTRSIMEGYTAMVGDPKFTHPLD